MFLGPLRLLHRSKTVGELDTRHAPAGCSGGSAWKLLLLIVVEIPRIRQQQPSSSLGRVRHAVPLPLQWHNLPIEPASARAKPIQTAINNRTANHYALLGRLRGLFSELKSTPSRHYLVCTCAILTINRSTFWRTDSDRPAQFRQSSDTEPEHHFVPSASGSQYSLQFGLARRVQ